MMTTNDPSSLVESFGIVGLLVSVIVALSGVLIWFIKSIKSTLEETLHYSKKAEHAVNGVGEGEHRLFDKVTFIQESVDSLIASQKEFDKKGWANLPSDLNTAIELTHTIRVLQDNDLHIKAALNRIENTIIDHISWEESQKYQIISLEENKE